MIAHAAIRTEDWLDLACRGLAPMYDPQTGLFCFKAKRASNGLVREGQSPRYSAITLLGLHRLEEAGGQAPVEIMPVLDTLLSNRNWVDNVGDLGLLLWLCAEVAPEKMEFLDRRLRASEVQGSYSDLAHGRTMELAWLLTGLCHWALACPGQMRRLQPLATHIYIRLTNNQGKYGIFSHAARNGSLAGKFRGWIGSFADQVYPIYAMSRFAEAYEDSEARARALLCARAICDAQGDKGQWWWHYDSSTGQVINGYPVFSVHQHGMAPMALYAIGDLAGKEFSPWIERGLEWINGNNELHYDMEDRQRHVVWRCIGRKSSGLTSYLSAAVNAESRQSVEVSKGLEVLFECRPYELGWMLYAFAGRSGPGVPFTSHEAQLSRP